MTGERTLEQENLDVRKLYEERRALRTKLLSSHDPACEARIRELTDRINEIVRQILDRAG